jgi:hypothetical protein
MCFIKCRCVCRHLKQFCSGNISMRLKYLKNLVEADDSCSEGLEYVELLLKQGKIKYEELLIHVYRAGKGQGVPFHKYIHTCYGILWFNFTDAHNHAITCMYMQCTTVQSRLSELEVQRKCRVKVQIVTT